MRLLLALLLACIAVAGGCGEGDTPDFQVEIVDLPGDGKTIRILGARPGSAYIFMLKAKSRLDRKVTLNARLVDPAPAGLTCQIRGRAYLMPRAEESPRLVFLMPTRVGTFQGQVEISCPETGWSRRWAIEGQIEDLPLEGAFLQVDPVGGSKLGSLKPGERRRVLVTLRATGSQPVAINEWAVEDRKRMTLLGKRRGGETIQPGGELQVGLGVIAPRKAGPFRYRMRVFSNAKNVPTGLDVFVTGRVEPDYASRPPRLEAGTVYPMHEREYRVVIAAAKGKPPFRVLDVTGHERHFKVVSKGGTEPAPAQEVVFKVLRKAPTDVAALQRFELVFRLGPDISGDVRVPVAMRFVPPIHADPPRLSFGVVEAAKGGGAREVKLATFANRRFKVKKVRCVPDYFKAQPHGGPGLPWAITVAPRSAKPGVYSATLVVTTDDESVPELRIPVYAEIR